MAAQNIAYSANTTITCSLASLATSATFVAGVESALIDNTSNLYVDALVQGLITVGTTPTANTNIIVYVWGSSVSPATTAIDVIDGTDSAETISSAGVRNSFMKIGAVLDVDSNTSNRGYPFSFGVAQLFGGVLPPYWGLFVAHNTAVNLNSTGGNHVISYRGVSYTVA